MATRTVYTSTALEVLTSANFEKMPKGWIGYESTSTDTTGVTSSVTDITDLTLTVTVPADRLVIVQGFLPRVASDTASDAAEIYVREGGTVLQSAYASMSERVLGSSGGTAVSIATAPFTPSTGAHTFKLSFVRASGGTGILETVCSATALGWIAVLDLGPSS